MAMAVSLTSSSSILRSRNASLLPRRQVRDRAQHFSEPLIGFELLQGWPDRVDDGRLPGLPFADVGQPD